jgi:hypothetical protein
MSAISKTLTPAQNDALVRPVAVPLKAGYAAFHHPLLVHGSFANSSSCSRRATVINLIKYAPTPLHASQPSFPPYFSRYRAVNVYRDGVTSATDDALLEGVPPVARGRPLDGQFFPLLSRA